MTDTLCDLHEFMRDLREFEQSLARRMDEFQCSVHLCIGQESVPAALSLILRPDDWLFSSHRNHGHYLAKGGDRDRLLAEIELRDGHTCGSQCYSDRAINFHASAIVGQSVGIAAGVASTGVRAFCCIGDAATEQGVFWETMNYAALKKLPLIVICEDNDLSIGVRREQRQAAAIADRVAAFGVPAMRVPGSDAVSVYQAIDHVANIGGPYFIEVQSVLQCPHMGADQRPIDVEYCPIENIRDQISNL